MTDDTKRIRLLGPVALEGGSEEQLSPRLRRLLAALVLGRGMQVSESSLIDVVWGEGEGDLPENPARSLQTYVSRLRSQLGPDVIQRSGTGYRLDLSEIWVDIAEFERNLERSRVAQTGADDRTAIEALDEALSLWSGAALSDYSGDAFAAAEAYRLDELKVDAEERRAELLIGLDDVDGALVADLERLARDHPHRDGPTRQLMRALHQSGRQADALAAFSRHRAQLATDLGLEPSDNLALLESQILTNDPGLSKVTRGRSLRGYDVLERLGEGAFSIVYRGTQPSVGRDVAIKQIRAELANRPEFIRRFETEAHLVARLENPHIVPLYDYWREPDSAYLVMRLLRGGNLEIALRSGPWELERAIRMVGHVGGALAAAHRAGIVHRDVKPANILLDEIGNSYLTDFGIALEAHEATDTAGSLSAGSPAYASPEQLRREPASPAADVHGMGIVLYETLTGRLPFPDEPTQAALLQRQLHDPVPSLRDSRVDVPPRLDAVIAKATAKVPTDRHQSIEEFVEAVEEAVRDAVSAPVSRGVTTSIHGVERNPYKGLRAFDAADADDFAGRSRLVDQLAATLGNNRFLAVVGPSGSGKSSAVRAGLLPALKRGAVGGSDNWFVTTMFPGSAPFEELETALLRVAAERPADLLGVLRDDNRGVSRGVRHTAPAEDAQVLLVIDQFEELFTVADPAVATRFLDALAVAVTEERSHLRVVVTLRADFYDRPLRHEAIGRLVRDATVAVLPLAADELEHAIVDPAAAVGAMYEPGLVSQIVADVADQPGALPMLQYALTELYERRVSGLLTQSAYRELGGVAGALARRAEELYLETDEHERIAIRRMFGRLVSLGEGVEDTRRRARRAELGDDDSVAAAIDRFGAARLLTFDRDPLSREPTVEVAHEALLGEWPRLRAWLDEDRDGLRILGHLHSTAVEWDAADRPSGELYRGGRLETAEDWVSSHHEDLNAVESDFVLAAVAARSAEIDARQRTTRRLRRRLTGVAIVAVFALIATALAIQQQRSASDSADRAMAAQSDAEDSAIVADSARSDAEDAQGLAERSRYDAESRRLTNQAAALAQPDPRAAMILAVAAHQRAPSSETLGALQRALLGSGPVVQYVNWGTSYLDLEWIEGDRLIATRADGVDLIDLASGTVESSLALTTTTSAFPSTKRTAVDSAGQTVAVLNTLPGTNIWPPGKFSDDVRPAGALSVFSLADGFEPLFEVPLAGAAAEVPLRAVALNVSMAPTGNLIVVSASSWTESVITAWSREGDELWQKSYPHEEREEGGAEPIVSVTGDQVFVSGSGWLDRYSYDGESLGPRVSVGGIHTVGQPATADSLFLHDVVETPSGWLAFGLGNSSVAIDRNGEFPETLVLRGLDRPGVARVDGAAVKISDQVLTAWFAGSVSWYDPTTGVEERNLDVGAGTLEALVLSPEGDRFAVAHSFGISVAVLGDGGPLAEAIPREVRHLFLTISPDGTRTAHGSFGDSKASGPVIWARDSDGWALDLGNPAESWVEEAMFMPDAPGLLYTRTNFRGEEIAYDVDTNEQVWHRVGQPLWGGDDVTDVGPYGQLRAINSLLEPSVQIYKPPDWDASIKSLERPGRGLIGAVAWISVRFDPAGNRLLLAANNGEVQLWDVLTWERIDDDFFSQLDIAVATWNTDGSIVATASSDGTISIRDGATFEVIRQMTGSDPFFILGSLILSDDDSLLISTVAGSPARLWDVATGRQIGIEFPNLFGALSYGNHDSDGIHLVTAAETEALIWNLDVDSWADLACRTAASNLTAAEWSQWGPRDTERYAVCPDYPL